MLMLANQGGYYPPMGTDDFTAGKLLPRYHLRISQKCPKKIYFFLIISPQLICLPSSIITLYALFVLCITLQPDSINPK